MLKAAVDVGFGRVKGFADNGRQVNFPSVVGEFHPIRFSSGMENVTPASRMAIAYSERKWFIGEAALRQTTPQSTVDMERTVTQEGILLMLGALSLLSPKNVTPTSLVVGLPVMHYSALRKRYHDIAKNTHIIDVLNPSTGEPTQRKIFVVESCKVLPQPFGALFDLLLNEQGKLIHKQLATGKIGVIDIGYNTLDLARADNLEYINPRSTSFSGLGMHTVFQALSNELYRNLGVEIPPEKIEPIVRSGELRVAGRVIKIAEYQRVALEAAAEQVVSRVKSIWPDRWELDIILITGGGALLLGNQLKMALGEQTRVAADPVVANARGYLKFAHRVWK